MRTAAHAPKITEQDALITARVYVIFMKTTPCVLLLDGHAVGAIYTLRTRALTVDDFVTLRRWKAQRSMQYSFRCGPQDPEEFDKDIQAAIRGLLDARRKAIDNPYAPSASHPRQHKALDFPEDLDMISHEVVNGVSHWKLPRQGTRGRLRSRSPSA